jgi:hypothetical protein
MADALHEGDQGRQPRAEQSRLLDRFRQGGVVELLAVRAPVGQPLVFGDAGRTGGDFHLLKRFWCLPRGHQCAAAIRAAVQGIGDDVIDRLGRKRRPQVLWMPRLPAAFPFLAALGPRLLRLDNVAGRRFGGGRGILACRSQLLLQERVLRFELSDPVQGFQQSPLQVGHTLSQPLGIMPRLGFRQLHEARTYRSDASNARSRCLTPNRRTTPSGYNIEFR